MLRTQGLFVCKRSQLENALRGHLVEYRIFVGQGMVQFRRMIATIDEGAAKLPSPIHTLRQAYIEQISVFDERIKTLDHEIKRRTKSDQATMWLLTISGFGPVPATTIQASAPPMGDVSNRHEFVVWCGHVQRQTPTGGRDIRRLLITGATAVIRWHRPDTRLHLITCFITRRNAACIERHTHSNNRFTGSQHWVLSIRTKAA